MSAWIDNIAKSRSIVRHNRGPRLVVPVVGSSMDADFWRHCLLQSSPDLLNADAEVAILPVVETHPQGNLLGTLTARRSVRDLGKDARFDIVLMIMIIGQGRRLSPFTQALSNRKVAFPTPSKGAAGSYYTICEIAAFSVNQWVDYLRSSGFSGVIVKWGDEAVFPGVAWDPVETSWRNVDAVRFVGRMEPSEDLAPQKEWIAFDPRTRDLGAIVSRQSFPSLVQRLQRYRDRGMEVGVNLGSVAVGYPLLDVMEEVFGEGLRRTRTCLNWDPYFWIALQCGSRQDWELERAEEAASGRTGLAALEASEPSFFEDVQNVRRVLEKRLNRALQVKILDFGEPLWIDLGQQAALREHFDQLNSDAPEGHALRALYGLPHDRDAFGNIVVNSSVAPSAMVRGSLLIDSSVGADSMISGATVIGSRGNRLSMEHGGALLWSVANTLSFRGPHAVAFRAICESEELSAGARYTSLAFGPRIDHYHGSESLREYGASEYEAPILGNSLSFLDLTNRVAGSNGTSMDRAWEAAASAAQNEP